MQVELQDQIDPALTDPRGELPLLRRAASCRPSSTSACRRCARATCRPSALDAMEPFYPLHVRICEELPARPARGVRRRRGHLQRVRLLLVVLRLLGRARARRTWRRWSSASGSTRTAWSSRSPATTATCCSTSSSAASRRSGVEPAANVAEAAREQGIETVVAFFGRETGRAARRRRRARRPAGRQQRPRARPRPERLRRRHGARARARRRAHDRVPAPAAADRGQPVRHDLPRALLLLLVPDGRARARAPTASRSSTSRSSPTHGGSLRVYAQHAGRTPAGRRRAVDELAERERALGFDTLEGYRAFAPRVEETKWRLLEFLIALPARGQAGRRLRRAGQGQHAAQLLRHPHRPARLTRSTATRTSRASSCRARTSRSAHPERARAGPARLHPDPALEPEATRSWRSCRMHAASGAPSSSSRSRR